MKTELTQEQKRQLIAKHLGIPWADYVSHGDEDHTVSRRKVHHLTGSLAGHSVTHEYCECGAWRDTENPFCWNERERDSAKPNTDYFADLNAMHGAEQANLQKLIKERYWLKLMEHEVPVEIEGENRKELVGHWNTTAAQRAEAFGLTMGLWT